MDSGIRVRFGVGAGPQKTPCVFWGAPHASPLPKPASKALDRAELTHKVNLFDLHHKYADVMHLDEVVAHLDAMRMDRAAE
jgi:hypothetical protein